MLSVVWAERAEELVGELADVLAEPLDDPFRPELVVVGSAGMRVWLRRRLAERLGAGPSGDGVAANLDLPLPGALRRMVLGPIDDDPWAPPRLLWPMIEVLRSGAGDEALGPAPRLPAGGTIVGRSASLVDRLDRYATHRPAMLRSWSANHDVDGVGQPLGDAQRWQPELWRRLRAAVGSPDPAERLEQALASLRQGDAGGLDLPERITVVGLSAASTEVLDVTEALATTIDVHLLLLAPSARLVELASPARAGDPRADDHDAVEVAHPLLATWAQPAWETARLVPRDGARLLHAADGEPSAEAPTLLARIQADLRAARAPGHEHRLAPSDRSIQIHGAHGPGRQVDVMLDALRQCFADDPTLTEADVVVLSPDPVRFSSALRARSGLSEPGGPPALRLEVADRAARQASPLLTAVSTVLEMADARLTASQLSHLLALPAVRSRFELDDADIELIEAWMREGHVRWGLDGPHRTRWGLPAPFEHGTWRLGVDRLLVGATTATTALGEVGAGGVVPLGVEGDEVRVAGALAAVVDALCTVELTWREPRPLSEWLELIRWIGTTLAAPSEGEGDRAELEGILRQAATNAPDERDPLLAGDDLRRLVEPLLAGGTARGWFGTGRITVAGLQPLHGVPHRVVCLLGLDDEAFGPPMVVGDDLIGIDPCLGDPDPRAEQRQRLLEAVLSARDHLIVTHTHRSPRSNEPVAEAPPLAELWALLDGTLEGDPAHQQLRSARLAVDHPRQASDARCFTPGELGPPGRPWSFDRVLLSGALARGDQHDRPLPPEVPEADDGEGTSEVRVTLEELRTLLGESGPEAFARHGLGVRVPRAAEDVEDLLSTQLDGLGGWTVGEGLLRALLSGESVESWTSARQLEGALPPGDLADRKVSEIEEEVRQIVEVAEQLDLEPTEAVRDVSITLGPVVVEGRVTGVDDEARRITELAFSRPSRGRVLRRWLDLLAITAADEGAEWQMISVRRQPSGARKAEQCPTVSLAVIAGDDEASRRDAACKALRVLVDLALEARRRPVPVWPDTSTELAAGRQSPVTTLAGELQDWDRPDPYPVLLLAEREPDDLLGLADPDGGDEPWAQRCADQLARVWDAVEELDPPEDAPAHPEGVR